MTAIAADGAWPIWVVSLADARERRRSIAAQLKALGLNFSFLTAIDGRRGLPAACEADVDRPGTLKALGHRLSDPEYACALSHQLAYKKIVSERLPGAIIFEDDALLTDRLRTFCQSRGYEAAPLIQFFYHDASVWKFGKRSTPAGKLMRLAARAFSTVGYSISAEAAAILHSRGLPVRGYADWPCETWRLFRHCVTVPRLVLHADDGPSAIRDSRRERTPADFDPTAGYAKGWRRLFSLASWQRLLSRPFKQVLRPPVAFTAEEAASLLPTFAPAAAMSAEVLR